MYNVDIGEKYDIIALGYIKPRLHIYIYNVLPSDISWTCDSREIPLETYNKKKPSAIMSYFSLMSTLYTLNYYSSRLFGIITSIMMPNNRLE